MPTTLKLPLPQFHSHSHNHSKPPRKPPQNRKLNPSVPYPKSSPIPLLTTTTQTTPISQIDALDRILDDVELSLRRGIAIDLSIFSSLLETTTRLLSLPHALRLVPLLPRKLLRNSRKLLRLLSSLGHVHHAHQMFDKMPEHSRRSPFVWNSLISGYSNIGMFEDALALYYQMSEDSVPPDNFTFPRVIKACAGLGDVRVGEGVHRDAVRAGFGRDLFVMNALVDMYSKCGDIVRARRVFDAIDVRDAVSWNSMIVGYLRHELFGEAMGVFRQMISMGVNPDSVTVSAVISSCAPFFNCRDFGLQVHGWIVRQGMEWELSVANSLIFMYSEYGRLDVARLIFDSMPEKDLVSWNTIIAAYRRDPRVVDLFWKMEESGILPDQVTFVSLLSGCAHLGLVEDGQRLFRLMSGKYNIKPRIEHYACMVNLLGRSGLVDEAYKLISSMPFEGGSTVWGALLYACSLHGNVDIGKVAAEKLFELEPDNEHNFELLMKIYSTTKRLDDVEKVRKLMMGRGLDLDSRSKFVNQ